MSASKTKGVAVVVGATGAFGRPIVGKLLQAELAVMAVARDAQRLAALGEELGPAFHACSADIASDTAIDTIAQAVRALQQPVRMVVHGPGVAVAGGIMQVPTNAMVDAVNIKVGGLLRVVRAVDSQLTAGARLIAIAGHYGLEPTAYAAAAGIANAALFNVVRQLSLAYGERGITAHTLAPGPADTERLRRVAADRANMQGTDVEAVLAEMRADSSLGALTTPDQVAWAVRMLLDPEAAAMTGSTLMLDSGRRRGLP